MTTSIHTIPWNMRSGILEQNFEWVQLRIFGRELACCTRQYYRPMQKPSWNQPRGLFQVVLLNHYTLGRKVHSKHRGRCSGDWSELRIGVVIAISGRAQLLL